MPGPDRSLLRRPAPPVAATISLWVLALVPGCSGAPTTAPQPIAAPVAEDAATGPVAVAPTVTAPPTAAPADPPRRDLEDAATRCTPELRMRTSVAFVPREPAATRDACLTLLTQPAPSTPILSKRCKQGGDPGACMLLASMVAPARWLTDEDFSVFVPPCKSKERCWTFLRTRVDPAEPAAANEAAAVDALETGCHGGAASACLALSRARVATKKGNADEAELSACELGLGLACRRLVYASRRDNLTPPAAALTSVVKTEAASCDRDGGDGASCLTLATLVDIGWATAEQAGKPEARLARGCELGHPIACAKTLELHVKNKRKATKPELERAASVLATHCSADQPFTCAMLAVAQKRGLGVVKDAAHSAAVWKAACDTPEKACANLGLKP